MDDDRSDRHEPPPTTRPDDPEVNKRKSEEGTEPTASMPDGSVRAVEPAGGVIGDFHVLRRLGAGGMGVVYEAEQQHPKRPVALKVIRGDRYVDETHVRLFQREAQALALLKHPSIAAIYESGRTEDGEHFFAMELVQGKTLDGWLAERPSTDGLSQAELELRLQVFEKICDGVAYAHQRGVIHRDIKPSNILIVDRDASGSGSSKDTSPDVKILDFGLARITDADVAATMMETEIGAIRGTYSYMSPEQIRGSTEEIDIRADVYSLGVVLYRMLTGELPYDVSGKPLHEISRIICEDPPQTFLKQWEGPRKPDQDLETITLKALEKDASRRYQSVTAFAEDITRFLRNEPILARPPSTVYQLRKMVQRHTAPFVTAAAIVVLLAVGVVVLSVQANTIARERDRANDEALTARATTEYLVDLFEITDPSETRGKNITVSELLARGAERLTTGLQDQPLVRAKVIDAIGRVYMNLGLYDEAAPLLEESYAVQRETTPEDNRYLAHALNTLAALNLYRGAYAESEQQFRESLEMRRRLFPRNSPEVAESLNNLGTFLLRKGDLVSAKDLFTEALDIQRELTGGRDEKSASIMNNVAFCEQTLGNHEEAERLNREALSLRRELLGDDHPVIAQSLNNLGMALYRRGEYDEAEKLVREAVELNLKIYGEAHPETNKTRSALASILSDSGRTAEAEGILIEVIAACRASLGANHPDVADDIIKLAAIQEKGGRLEASEGNFQKALTIQRQHFAENSWQIATTKNLLGNCLTSEGRYGEAEPLLVGSFQIISNTFGEDHPRTAAARRRVIANYEAWGKPEQADPYRRTGGEGG
jgi:serine/threonine protein kinase/tetratricopeptide (TPR) repeat protein